MFKNFTPYRFSGTALAASLTLPAFVACGPTQAESIGFVPHEKHLIVRIERRVVPADALKRRVDELADQIKETTGCKPGKKARVELTEQAHQELLPRAFPKRKDVHVTFLEEQGLMLVGATSPADTDAVTTLLGQSAPEASLMLSLLLTAESPAAVMSAWLLDSQPAENFQIERSCELTSTDGLGSRVKYDKHSLDRDDVRDHLRQGKAVSALALSYANRLGFTLTDGLQFKGVTLLDLAFEGHSADAHPDAADAELFLWRAELSKMLDGLIDVFGGVSE